MSTKENHLNRAESAAASTGDPVRGTVSRGWQLSQLGSGGGLALLALAACWLLLFDGLRSEWKINPQYGYGWLVPFLALSLFWRSWPDRPPANPALNKMFLAGVAFLLVALLLPLRVMLEANPEWRLLYWVNGFQAVGLTACFLFYLGGLPWLRFFLPPLLFTLIAIPWPVQLEQAIIQGLMRFVAGLTVETAGWLGIPAVQHGNLVEIGAGMVGIDEACSGVRSLQSGLMVSLFLGELYRFSPLRRVALVAASIALVLVANMGRTTFLVWAVAEYGFKQMEAWHDSAGWLVAAFILPSLLLLGWLMKPQEEEPVLRTPSTAITLPAVPRWIGIAVLLWVVVAEISTEVWYRTHETQLIAKVPWLVTWPTQSREFKQSPLPENALTILRCDDSESATWRDEEGNAWSAFFLRWDPGKNSAQLAKGHRPEICLTSAGARLVEDLGVVQMSAGRIDLEFRHQTFEAGSRVLHVFHCLWADRVSPAEKTLLDDGSQASRLQSVLAGKRHLGQQVLEVVIQGPETAEEAVAMLKAELAELVRQS